MFRRVTLLWINLLNRCPAPSSRSLMLHSNTCNCSSLQTTEVFFWNAFKTMDDLGIAICLARSCTVDSRREPSWNVSSPSSPSGSKTGSWLELLHRLLFWGTLADLEQWPSTQQSLHAWRCRDPIAQESTPSLHPAFSFAGRSKLGCWGGTWSPQWSCRCPQASSDHRWLSRWSMRVTRCMPQGFVAPPQLWRQA